jgi:hypothetical protein
MSKRSIEIDHVQIRLKGVAPELARAAMGGLGSELLTQLARQQGEGRARTGNIEHVHSGSVRLTSGASASELRSTIAGRIAVSINSTPHKL